MPNHCTRQLLSVERIFVGILVDPNPAGLDDPRMTDNRWLKRGRERVDGVLEMHERSLRRQAQDGNAPVIRRAVTKRVSKLEIERDQAPLFPT